MNIMLQDFPRSMIEKKRAQIFDELNDILRDLDFDKNIWKLVRNNSLFRSEFMPYGYFILVDGDITIECCDKQKFDALEYRMQEEAKKP